MELGIFYQLAAIMIIVAALSLMMHLLRQPLIVGYILAGILVGPTFLDVADHSGIFEIFSDIGVALLLFIIGLGLNATIIRSTGKTVLLTFTLIAAVLGGVSYLTGKLLGFSDTAAMITAIAMLFSSTIIVGKAISDKKEQSRLYGQIAIGILLVEDMVATLALLYVSAGGHGSISSDLLGLLLKGVGLAALLTFVGAYLLPKLGRLFAESQELLYIFAIAWVFGIGSLFSLAGFSMEIGALFAGVSLAHLPYAQSISARLKLLRDFFIVLFFIQLGSELNLQTAASVILPAVAFSVIVLITKPLLIMTSLGLLGYTKQTGFRAGIHLSQISEFSIILIVLAGANNLVGNEQITIITLTAMITIIISSYLMSYDRRLYHRIDKWLDNFERKNVKPEPTKTNYYPLVLLGYRQGGYSFVQTFRQMKKRYVVVDYDPEVIESLADQHINHLYGDATDEELLEEIGIHKSELIISDIRDAATNQLIAAYINRVNPAGIFICHASSLDEVNMLYQAGASYVLLPEFIGNEHINRFIKLNGSNKQAFSAYREQHLLKLSRAMMRKDSAFRQAIVDNLRFDKDS